MSRGRLLGLDPGERRIGVALSDPLGIIAQPHEVIDLDVDDLEERLQSLCEEYDIESVVVGLPISLSGEEGPAARAAREFADVVAEIVDCPVVHADERFTTVTAEQSLLEAGMRRAKRKDVRDKVAAAIMLQSYIDRRADTE